MSNILLYNEPLKDSFGDFVRATSERVEHTDYYSTEMSTFVNNHFVFYVPPPNNRVLDSYRLGQYGGYEYKTGQYIVANLSSIQLFSYENGATVQVEWLNCSLINDANYNVDDERWELGDQATVQWLENLPTGKKITKRKIELGEFDTEQIQLNAWVVWSDFRILGGIVKVTSDYPISVMHHKLYPIGTMDYYGYELVNENWDGIYSAYGKKLFTRITRDCWISALDSNTEIKVWDYTDSNDDITLTLDRFEGWAYTRNPIFEQYGFDDDLVLISADKPVSIVAGLQADMTFTQIFGKDGKDFMFPCFGKIIIHAPEGADINLKDSNGNQGTYKGHLDKNEMKVFDFKVAYKVEDYSSFEWAQLITNKPVFVYTYADNTWQLDEDYYGYMAGEEYITKYKKIYELYPNGIVPYPADTEFEIPLRSNTYVTIVNLENSNNDVEVDFSRLIMPYEAKLDKYQPLTFDFSEDSYYEMNLINPSTGNREDPSWLFRDPYNRHHLDRIPRIAVHNDDVEVEKLIHKLSQENITKGSTLKVKAKHPVLVFINYMKDNSYYPQGMDLIPGLGQPAKRGLPDFTAWVVILSGIFIAVDIVLVSIGRKSMIEGFLK
jgi:hypothetical protein